MFNLRNFIAYQIAWFAVVLGAAQGYTWAGITVALAVTALHLWQRREPLEFKLVAVALIIGLIVDTTLAASGQVSFAAATKLPMAPFWMLSLWLAFATTLNHSLRWLMRQPIPAALAGAVFGPLAYLAGARLGALTLASPTTALPLIAALWFAAMLALARTLRHAPAATNRSLPA